MRNILLLFFALLVISGTGNKAAAQTISSHTVSIDSACGQVNLTVNAAGCTGSLTLKTYFGDGTDQTNSIGCFSGTGTAYLYHTYLASGTYTVKMVLYNGSLAVDSSTFSQPITFCSYLPVFGFIDQNSNCVYDLTESVMHTPYSVAVDSAGTVIDTVYMSSGMWYKAMGPIGTIYGFRVIAAPSGLISTCPATGFSYTSVTAAFWSPTPVYLGFECTASTAFDLALTATFHPALAGGGANNAGIFVTNSSCSGTAAIVRFDYSPKYTFSSIYPSTLTYTVTGTSVSVNIGTVSPTSYKYLSIKLTPVTTLTLGDTVNSTFTVLPTSGDANPANNMVVRCDTVRASYDPNAKTVTPSGNIAAGTRLEYMLQFENDGNDTAHNIHIMDTLSNYLDISTLKMGVSSHNVQLISYNDAGANILKFDFPNIMLPDSAHHDVCRGMVTFSINAKTTLAAGTTIPNRVGIYFDVNPVVMTNTAFSHIPLPTGVQQVGRLTEVELYPNPVTDQLTLKTVQVSFTGLAIYNVMGQQVATQELSSNESKVNVRSLAPGIYYIALKGAAGARTIKFEKL